MAKPKITKLAREELIADFKAHGEMFFIVTHNVSSSGMTHKLKFYAKGEGNYLLTYTWQIAAITQYDFSQNDQLVLKGTGYAHVSSVLAELARVLNVDCERFTYQELW